jgi:hypothetical protein
MPWHGIAAVRKAAAILAGISLSGFASAAAALDLEIKSRLVQSLEASDNYQLSPQSPGPTYSSISTLIFDSVARTPTMRFASTTDFSYRTFFGPGGEDISPARDYGTRLRAENKVDSQTTAHFDAAWRFRSASAVQAEQLEETGNTSVGSQSGDTTTESFEGGFRRQLGPRDALTWSARGTSLEGSGSVTSNKDFLTTAVWTHQLNRVTYVSPTGQFESIKYENLSDTEVTIWKGWLAFDTQLSKRLAVRGSIGGVFLTQDQRVGSVPITPFAVAPFIPGSGSASDWIGDLLITYKLNNTTSLTLAAAQSVGPDTFGTIRKTDIAGVVLSYRINRASFLSFSGDFSHQISSQGTSDLYSAGVRYGYDLTRDWNLALSYRFRHRAADSSGPANSGPANSNSVLLVISKNLTILPAATGGPVQVAADSSTILMASAATWAMTRRFSDRY